MSGNIVPPEGPPLEYWFGQYSDHRYAEKEVTLRCEKGWTFDSIQAIPTSKSEYTVTGPGLNKEAVETMVIRSEIHYLVVMHRKRIEPGEPGY